MPVYEYRCNACSHEFEEWQKISDPPVKTCPKCKKKKVERLISATAFHLKGGGWYKDLYSSSKGSSAASSAEGSSSESKSDSKSETKSDSKSETKSDSKSDSKPKSESKKSPGKSAAGK